MIDPVTDQVLRKMDGGMSDEEYIKRKGLDCPYCRASCEFACGEWNEPHGIVSRDWKCNNCGKIGRDHYQLVQYEALPDDYAFEEEP